MKKDVLLYLVVVALALAAGCANGDPEKGTYSGHAAFIKQAKAGW